MTLEEMMFKILDNSCSNPVDHEEWMKCGQDSRKYTGWYEIYVETHCLAWRITAKKAGEQWVVKEAKAEDC